MPKYLSDHEIYDRFTKAARPVQILLECPHTVIEHLPTETFAHIAYDMPEKGFTITVKLTEPKPEQPKPAPRKRKR